MGYRGLLAGSAVLMMACSATETPLEPKVAGVPSLSVVRERSAFSLDISGVLSDPCVGEDIAISGRLKVRQSSLEDGNGGFHVQLRTRTDISGVGASSGALYHGKSTEFVSGRLSKGETFTQHSVTHLVGQGQNPNLKVILKIHFTVNANGERTAETERLLEC